MRFWAMEVEQYSGGLANDMAKICTTNNHN